LTFYFSSALGRVEKKPTGEAAALAGNRNRASRMAGENSTTEPPMRATYREEWPRMRNHQEPPTCSLRVNREEWSKNEKPQNGHEMNRTSSSLVWWRVSPPVTRETGVRIPYGEAVLNLLYCFGPGLRRRKDAQRANVGR